MEWELGDWCMGQKAPPQDLSERQSLPQTFANDKNLPWGCGQEWRWGDGGKMWPEWIRIGDCCMGLGGKLIRYKHRVDGMEVNVCEVGWVEWGRRWI